MNLQENIRRILREDSRVYDYDPERNTVPFDERLPFDVDKLLSVGAVFITPAIDGDPKSKTYKKWLNEPYVHLITLKNVLDSKPDSWIHKAITKKGDPESYRKDFVYKFYDGKYNQILWSLEKLGIDPNGMIEDKDNSIQESIRRILREENEGHKVKLVKRMIHSLYDEVSFIEQSTYNNKPLLKIYFDSDDTAANIESWFDEKISSDIDEWTSGNIVVCPSWIFNWDSRKKNADVFINTELIKYDNLGNVVNESILREETSSEQIKDIILNGTDFDDWIRAIKMKYGDIVSLYHATTKENSKLIDKEGFKLVDGKNYKSFGKEPILYFQIGKSDYQAENRPVLYRLDVPIDFLYNADIDMDGPNISDETLFKYVDEETWDDLPYEIRDAIIYFIWNDFKLDGTEIFITDRFMDKPGEDIFKGLTPKKIKK